MYPDAERFALAKSIEGGSSPAMIPYKEQLKVQLVEWEKRCEKLKELIQLLDENPAIEKFMSLSRQV